MSAITRHKLTVSWKTVTVYPTYACHDKSSKYCAPLLLSWLLGHVNKKLVEVKSWVQPHATKTWLGLGENMFRIENLCSDNSFLLWQLIWLPYNPGEYGYPHFLRMLPDSDRWPCSMWILHPSFATLLSVLTFPPWKKNGIQYAGPARMNSDRFAAKPYLACVVTVYRSSPTTQVAVLLQNGVDDGWWQLGDRGECRGVGLLDTGTNGQHHK